MHTPPDFQWTTTAAPAASSRYDDIWFVTPDVGWAVNNSGTVLKTTDGGKSWVVQLRATRPNGRPVYLRCLAFVDDMHGWVGTTTEGQRMYRTKNGGDDWEAVGNLPSGNPHKICGLYAVDGDVIYASGTNNPADGAAILKTEDGGTTWSTIDMSEYASNLIDIYFTSPERGFVVGGHTDDPQPSYSNVKPVVLETTDGGATWTDRISDIRDSFPEGSWGWKIQFLNAQLGFVSLENLTAAFILKTTDGGASWTRIDVQGNANLEGVGMLTEKHGWVGGWGDASFSSGTSSVTDDGGAMWLENNEIGRFINRFRYYGDPLEVGYASGRSVYKYAPVPAAPAPEPEMGSILSARGADVSFSHALPIEFATLRGTERVTVDVWDRFTNEVGRVLDLEAPEPGMHTFEWNGTTESGDPVEPGIYLYRVSVDGEAQDRVAYKQDQAEVPTWEKIKGYFRRTDIEHMCNYTGGDLDLGYCKSVLDNASDIYDSVKDGSMPIGGPAWSDQMVQDFHDWWKSNPECPPDDKPTCK